MHYVPVLFIIFGGITLLLDHIDVIDVPDFVWSIVGSILVISTGIGLIIAGKAAIQYKKRIIGRLSNVVEKIERLYETFELQRQHNEDSEYGDLTEIVKLYSGSPSLYRASKFWDNKFIHHIRWLRENGIANFKRSVNLGYFQWKIGLRSDQLSSVLRGVHISAVLRNFFNIRIPSALTDSVGTACQNRAVYRLFMAGLLDKLRSIDHRKLFDSMAEPLYGNPWPVYYKNRLISQDLCNSLIEFYSIANSVDFHKPIVIGELGAGYGRLCYVFLKALSNVKYVIFDIPPAIYISQWYLQKVFPDKRIFKLRAFQSFREIQDEYEQCEVAFFLPEQMELFPEKHFHLFVNVSSFGEMRLDQIRNYFSQINRLTHGYLYSKQWITSVNPEDNLVICQEDYPVPQNWATLYRRPAEIQRKFFEALYRID